MVVSFFPSALANEPAQEDLIDSLNDLDEDEDEEGVMYVTIELGVR